MKWLIILLVVVSCKGGGSDKGSVLSGGASNGRPDPLAAYLWHIKNTAQDNFSSNAGTSGNDVNLGTVHDSSQGRGIKIVVSDSRVEVRHEDLVYNTDKSNWRNYNLAFPYIGDPTTSDSSDSHGTAVMSIIGAVKDNGVGIFGIAPGASLIGTNFVASDQSISKMVDQANISVAEIYNYSWGSLTCMVTPPRTSFLDTVRYNTLRNDNIYVTASGNDRSGDATPCGGGSYYNGNANLDQWKSYPYVLVVAASNSYGNVSSFSTPGSNLWVAAPGGEVSGMGVPAADLQGCSNGYATSYSNNIFDNNSNGLNRNCNYVMETTVGTSFSSPIVSGAVALLKEANPSLSWRDIKHIFASTSVQLNPTYASWVTNAAGYKHSYQHGFGQINIESAVNLAKNKNFNLYRMKETINDFSGESSYKSGDVNIAIPDNDVTGVSSVINVNDHNLSIEYVQIKLNITHTAAQDLDIRLMSPSNTEVKILFPGSWIVDSSFTNLTLGISGFYGERTRGNWTLKIKDMYGMDTGTLVNWSIKIQGNKGSLPDVTPPEPATGLTNTGNDIQWVASTSGDIARYEACVVPDGTEICDDHDWINLGNTTSKTFTHENGDYNNPIVTGNYKVFIRAIDLSENESTLAEHSWIAP